mgnify:CR=1 FL=1
MDRDEIVFEQYYEDVYRFLRALTRDRDLAEELTQETFLRAIRSIDTYRGEGEFRVWLCSIAKNLFYSQMKKQKKSIPVADEDFPEGESQEKTLIDRIADRETAMEIYQALHRLRDPYKEVFSLRVFGELSFREIGGLFEKSEHWACVTYHRARQMILREVRGGESKKIMEVMDYTIYSTGKDRSALTGVLDKFLEKAQSAVSSALVGSILIAIGYEVDSVTGDYIGELSAMPSMLTWMTVIMGLVPAILAVIAVLIISRYPIDQAKRKEIQAYINEHQAAGTTE